MEQEILNFVRVHFKASMGSRLLEPDTPLFSAGIVDSFGVLELIAFLEDRFRVQIDPARHDLSEFDTASKIAALLQRLTKVS